MSQLKIDLSVGDVNNINLGRKRKVNLHNWKQKQRKFLRNCGIGYVGRNGVEYEDKDVTNGEKICGPRCSKTGCSLDAQEKIGICRDFWRVEGENYRRQSNILFALIEWKVPTERTVNIEESRRRATFTYFLRRSNGFKAECCFRTFLDTFQITKRRVEVIQKKMLRGDTMIEDLRGTHQNRPYRHTDESINLINEHIHSFPTYLTHYSRKAGDPLRLYLDPHLNASKMYRLFVERFGNGVENLEHAYKDILRATKLRFGVPKSDTCGVCDRLYQRLCNHNPANVEAIQITQEELNQHHTIADFGYAEMKRDIDLGKEDDSLIVLCIDLQQILLSPRLSHGEMYYKRKFSSYNLAITSPCIDQSTMVFWNESDGNRGQNDVGSAIYQYITQKFALLEEGETRTLCLWSDRCSGQNNNYSNICLFKYLIYQRYFSEINQKFLVSGHTFLSCDRHFAVIERAQKNEIIHNPNDWIKIIEEARVNNPFEVMQMSFNDFRNISSLKPLIPKPVSLMVSQYHWIQLRSTDPSNIRTKVSHSSDWVSHSLRMHTNRRTRICSRPEWDATCFENFEMPRLYENGLELSQEKLADIRSMMDYLPTAKQRFYDRWLAVD